MVNPNNVNILISNGIESVEYAKQALDNKLYNDGWLLKPWLERVIAQTSPNKTVVAIARYERPIGVAIYCFNKKTIMVYVEEAQRLLGIGTKLVKGIIDKYGLDRKVIKVKDGIEGADLFYTKNGICSINAGYLDLTESEGKEFLASSQPEEYIQKKYDALYQKWLDENRHLFNF